MSNIEFYGMISGIVLFAIMVLHEVFNDSHPIQEGPEDNADQKKWSEICGEIPGIEIRVYIHRKSEAQDQ